ncbi:MAG TPA: hypothetical protein VNU26_03040 [Mycobacteriales bacterium]|nr:hypothetical protein [Mycobacteriales bacterium]
MTLAVVAAGPFTTVQDLGRRGRMHQGVARSGAADRGALRLANRLVGNDEATAGLEVLAGGLVLRAEVPHVVAVTGAEVDVGVGGRREARGVALRMGVGDHLRLAAATAGLRAYVAVRGGIDVPPVLGSRSYDQLGDLGPRPSASRYGARARDAGPRSTAAAGAAPGRSTETAPEPRRPAARRLRRAAAGPVPTG